MKKSIHAPKSQPMATVNNRFSRFEVPAAVAMVFVLGLCSCAQQGTRVRDVEGRQYKETIGKADNALYVTDRASHLRVEPRPLPHAERREEYYVTWSGSGISQVKFEYRQVNIPDKILVQTVSPTDKHWNIFTVAGDDFSNGGPISAWRVSLWDGDRLLAERKSVLW